jgi:hypothetical protein
VAGNPFYKDHWINIDRDRLDQYQRMFQWNAASSGLYEPADIRLGHIVADFGCGPGHTAIEIAKWVGSSGHVHDDPEHTIREFRRVLRTGGKVHAIEGDWPMMIVEPVPSKDWAAFVNAASHACRTPDIGRKLYGLMGLAGFSHIDVRVVTRPDTDGRLLPMIKNMAGYARGSGKTNDAGIEKILSTIEQAISRGRHLALAPQFVVTATR